MSKERGPKKGAADASARNTNEPETKKDFEVGYGRPPKHTQFKKGQSGNPKGRKKGTRNFRTEVEDVLLEPIRATSDGKTRKVANIKAALWRLRSKALKGDARALDLYLKLGATYLTREDQQGAAAVPSDDQETIRRALERLSRSKKGDSNE